MNVSPKFVHALQLVERVTFTTRHDPSCVRCGGSCWTTTVTAAGEVGGQSLFVAEGPYEHRTLPDALDIIAIVSAHHSSALELLGRVHDDRQLTLTISAEEIPYAE